MLPDNHDEIVAALSHVSLLSALTEQEIKRLASKVKVHRLKKNQSVVEKGDPSDSLIFVLSGRLNVVEINREGQLVALASLDSGMHLGEMGIISGRPRSATVVTETSATIGYLRKADAVALISEHSSVAWEVMQRMASMLNDTNAQLLVMNLPQVRDRIEAVLMMLAKTYHNIVVVEQLPSQQNLANRCNTSRETVSRVLSQLVKEGLIERDNRRLIIRRPELLRQVSDF
ncbi:MAG: Crp/Fnr family transcriptional regulator [Hydrogenovibrio sp.]|uniref:Crp/Fnr family transcriptional regulator n=1 Tax=Hydrogenovibrio sp. TaxID=2065821 RepID=UPI00287079A1|nr:Crp/Fnr family transcriptional regulator [Hydrogenovibrio sp.]MDR9499885.1 Crp/Fnr family transcriptional regulator [Hydrogenovibrio sp.]